MLTQNWQALCDDASVYALRKAELEIAHNIQLARCIQKRKLKKEDKAYWQGVIDNYTYTFNEIRHNLRRRGCVVYKPSNYIELLGETNA